MCARFSYSTLRARPQIPRRHLHVLSTSPSPKLVSKTSHRKYLSTSQIFREVGPHNELVEVDRGNMIAPFVDSQELIQYRIQNGAQNGLILVLVRNIQRGQGFLSLRCLFQRFFSCAFRSFCFLAILLLKTRTLYFYNFGFVIYQLFF